jgi:hypothetical protein
MHPHEPATDHDKPAILDYGLKSAFLSALDPTQKLRVFDLTTRASRELHRWATAYPLIRRVRVWPLCLSIAASMPFAPAKTVVTVARMNLWGFSIDDLFDEEIVPMAELQRRIGRYREVLAGAELPPHSERDTLALALQDIRRDLSGYPLYEALRDRWADAVDGLLDGMVGEHGWRLQLQAGAAVPDLTYAAYMGHSLRSIGVAVHAWTLLIALDDRSALQHLDHLQQMERSASLCIRLANDLQSYEREVTEGKLNSIAIRRREELARGIAPADSLRAARSAATAEVTAQLARLTALQRQRRTSSGHPEQAIADLARFVSDFYIHHDYHTFVSGTGRPG